MAQPFDSENTGTLSAITTTTAHMVAVRLKSANKHIFRALLSLASAALLIRVVGLLNQIVVTGRFGAGAAMDAYFVASSLPILLAQLISSAIEGSVIPVYARVRTRGTKEQRSILFSTLLNISLISTALLTLILLALRHQMILLSAPALDPFRAGLALNLAPFIYPVLLLMVMIAFFECILNTEDQFGWPAYAGMLVSLTTVILVLTAGKSLGVVTLCIGMLIGLCLQLCVIVLRVRRTKLIYRPIIDLRNPAIGLVLIAAWPEFFNALISQASPLVDQIFASSLSAGSISALSYSLKLISVPSGVIFASVGRAMLPYLSRQATAKDLTAFKETLRLYLWAVAVATTVLAVFMLVLAHPIVRLLFQRGAFSAEDTNHTASTLMGFLVGLTPMSFGFITAKAFTALGKNRILLYVTIFSVIANAVFDYIFAHFWQSMGIALSTSGVYCCTMFILLLILRRMIGKLNLFTPPIELVNLIGKLGMGSSYIQKRFWKVEKLFSFSYRTGQQIIRITIVLTLFAIGVVGVLQNALYTLRTAFGSIIVLAFLRYRYALLITWVMLDAFIGSTLPFFNGNNLDTALTAPTLLVMTCMPIKKTFKRMPALAFMLVFLLWVFAGIGISPIGTTIFLREWLLLLDSVAVGILTINVLTTRQRMIRLIDTILAICTLISLYGIYGYFEQLGSIRTASIFGDNAPTLALFLSLIIPLAIYRIFTLRGLKQVVVVMLLLLFLVTFATTFTRTSFVSVPISIVVLCFFLPSRKMKVVFLGSVFAVGLAMVLVATAYHIPLFERFFSQDVTTLNNRTYFWQAVLDHFDPTQILGNGLDASLMLRLDPGDTRNIFLSTVYDPATSQCLAAAGCGAHNLFLGALYDQGLIGLALLVAAFVTLFINILKGARKAIGDHHILYGVVLAVFINTFFQWLDSTDFWMQAIGIYFWIIVALPFALCWSPAKPIETDTEQESLDEAVPRMKALQQAKQESVPVFSL